MAASAAAGSSEPQGAASAASVRTAISSAASVSPANPAAAIAWLRQYMPFSVLGDDALTELVKLMEVQQVPKGTLLQGRGEQPKALYVLRQGSMRVLGNVALPGVEGAEAGPGVMLNFTELLLDQPCSSGASCICDCTLWAVRGTALLGLAAARPDLMLQIGLKLGQEFRSQAGDMAALLKDEEKRKRALQPFLITAPKRGIIGGSRYADRLRKQIVVAARDRERGSVLVFGEPGLGKSNVAALVHFGGLSRGKQMVQIDCDKQDVGADLFGRGSRKGLLHWIQDGTVLLNNVHKLPRSLLPQVVLLMTERTYQPLPGVMVTGSMDLPLPAVDCQARILFTAEQRMPALEPHLTVITVPPVRVRPADIRDLERFFLRDTSRRLGVTLALTPEAERQLESHSWPGNIQELEALVNRAAVQVVGPTGGADASSTPTGAAAAATGRSGRVTLDKDVFWFAAQAKDRFRLNLLNPVPALRQLLRSNWFPERLNHDFVKYVFALVVAVLFIGPQDRDHNAMLSIFWNYWWPLIFLVYPFLGRIWCSICPFMIYGEVVQRWRIASGAKLLKWPRAAMEAWGGWFLFGLFAAILVWEEVWDLPQTAYLSSWLLLIITGGAMVCSYFFERRLWCRYLCPIGGMNGLFAKLSMTELRARQGVCAGSCKTYHCFKGGPAEAPEGLETNGCPLYSHPAQLTDNRNCVLCMECLKACPHRSVEFRLRLPGSDLWLSHEASWHEVALMFMLLGAVYLHRLPELCDQFGVDINTLQPQNIHILASAALLATPGAICWAVDAASRALPRLSAAAVAATTPAPALATGGPTGGPTGATAAAASPSLPPYLGLSYAYLPLVWAATLSHYELYLLNEAGAILPVAAATVGLDGSHLPVLAAHPAVISFLQGSTLLLGASLSLLLTRKVGARPWAVLAGQCGAIVALTAELWYLIVR